MAKKVLYWEDVEEGSEIPAIPKVATTRMLVKWAGAWGDFNPLHYEDTFAASHGMEKVVVQGQLKRAWLVQLITDWMGEEGFLHQLSCQFRGIDYPRLMKLIDVPEEGETWWCRGEVKNKYVKDDEHYVECEIWVENEKGEKTTMGNATVVLPSRSGGE